MTIWVPTQLVKMKWTIYGNKSSRHGNVFITRKDTEPLKHPWLAIYGARLRQKWIIFAKKNYNKVEIHIKKKESYVESDTY